MKTTASRFPVICYLLLTVVLCLGPYALIAAYGLRAADRLYVTALMWGPALAALLTVRLANLRFSSLGLAWTGWRSNWASYLLPIGYGAVAYGIVWSTGLGGFAGPEQVLRLAQNMGWEITDRAIFIPLYALLIGTVGMVTSTARALGEEIGWRGFLAPRLHDRFGFTGGAALTGLIWTAWHVPLIAMSDYTSSAPLWFALTCFFIMVMALSFIMAWFRLWSASVWPAAILHGSHNLFVQNIFTPLTTPHGDRTAYAIDEFGFMLAIIISLAAFGFWLKRGRAVAAYESRRAAFDG